MGFGLPGFAAAVPAQAGFARSGLRGCEKSGLKASAPEGTTRAFGDHLLSRPAGTHRNVSLANPILLSGTNVQRVKVAAGVLNQTPLD